MARAALKKKSNPAQTAFSRFLLVVAFFVIWIGVIGVRLVHLQVNQSEWLRGRALDQRRDESKSKTLRGSILDRTGRTLALSVKVKSLYADPAEIEDVEATAKAVAAALKIKPQDILNNLREAKESRKRFVWLARKIDDDQARRINEALKDENLKKADEPRFAGLHWKEEQKRSYPYSTLAAQVIGFSSLDDAGQAGIELSQEENLRGAIVKKWQDRDRLGRVYDESETEEREPPKDIVLTISHSIQYKVEQALARGVQAARAKSGAAIVIEPQTGEILAMANYPTFDPNKTAGVAPEMFTNRAIQNIYSPGSVFKLVTYGAALEERVIDASGTIDTSQGYIQVGGRRFTDHHSAASMSYDRAMAVSSNVVAIRTATAVGKDRFHNYIRQFGFGDRTGIELPAEARGQVRPTEVWNGDSLASMSIGYEIGVTALQTAAAFATIANDGLRVSPHIIKEIRQADGKVLQAAQAERVPVVSADTARSLRRMLREVVVSGTGKRAQVEGYTTAGKTGTAWKYDPKLKRVNAAKYVSSFIGFAPAEKPSVVIAVVLDEPQVGARDGGQVSAPIFREIAEGVLPELNVVPDAYAEKLTAQNGETEAAESQNESIPPSADLNETEASNEPKADRRDAALSKNKAAKEKNKPLDSTRTAGREPLKSPKEEKSTPPAKTVLAGGKPKSEAKNKSSTEKNKPAPERTKNKT